MLVHERAEAVLVEAGHLACDQLHAAHIDRLSAAIRAAAHGGLHLGLLQLTRQPAMVVEHRAQAYRQLGGTGIERRSRLRDGLALLAERFGGTGARDGLDAPHTRGHAAFGGDREEADVAGGADVRPAAELHAEAGHGDHADRVAVLLAEERHRTGGDRLLGGAHLGRHGRVRQHLRVDDAFDLEELVWRHGGEVLEVEPEALR